MSSSAVEVNGEKKGNRPGTHFTKDGWLKIMINVEKETCMAYSQRQLKNRWDALKKEWKAWKKIKGRDTSDKARAPSSGTLRSDFFEDVDNEIPEKNKEENLRNDVHILNDVHIDGNKKKRKTPEISTSHFKTGRKKSSKQIGEATRLSRQREKLCNAADNMSQATSSLTPIMDPYEVPEASPLFFFSLKLLLNKDKRIMFSSINPKIRALWLKTEMEDS
uniref:Myb/SANT-like domain-containing protein n=1 Tax=Gossypium raimondii TaxID=29730 RepID=A0A0D2PUU9_GOSRA|nr:hypothetical protein B456_001G209600 [Gossypium raimondii]